MLCHDCKKRESQVHLTQIVNNEKTSVSLCKECAAARGFHSPLENVPFPLAEILSGMAANLQVKQEDTEEREEIICPQCGLSFDQFTRQGRFGCGACYGAFRHALEPIMRKIHGASLHRGQVPEPASTEGSETKLPVKEEERLDSELKKAIGQEDFERAAELRDKLKSIREKSTAEEV